MQQQIGRLMMHANFGRKSSPTLFLAHHYRLMVAVLTGALILSHLLITRAPLLLFFAVLIYAIYVALRLRIPLRLEGPFYTPRIQFWRAQAGIAGVTALLFLIGSYEKTGSLWVLYLGALLLISRYCEQESTYVAVALEVVVLAAGAHLWELTRVQESLTSVQMVGELGVRAFGVLLPSFLIHYLARVDITSKRGAAARNQVVQLLLEQAMFETDSRALWWAVRDACAMAVNATESCVYIYDQERGLFQQLVQNGQGHFHERQIALADDHPALRAFQSRLITEEIGKSRLVGMAAPVFGQPNRDGPPLAVVMLHLRVNGAFERRAAGQFLTELLDHIWPICAYASLRQQFPLIDQIGNREVYRLHLDEVIEVVLDTLCNRLGFSFATISLVNEDTREISTVRGRNVPPGWVADAHHNLSSHDIQADVVRTGKVEVIDGWDPRFDEQIWKRYGHADLLRVWVPLGRIGTIEAGFYKNEKSEVPRLLIELLKRYALDVTVAIQNAQHYEREQRQAVLMARLHEASYDLQTDPCQRDETTLLEQITRSALDLLGASVIVLLPLNRRDDTFAPSICVGLIEGRRPLAEPNAHDNIVQYIAETRLAYYQPDAQSDPQLVGEEQRTTAGQGHRTFTRRQNILSFAGAPLLARGRLLGVLCVNYRQRRQFSAQDRQVIELFAQQAAAVIAGGELVRNRERRRLEYDLHDSVKSGLRGLILFSKAASSALDRDPARARKQLHEIRRSAWVILGDLELVLHDLAQNGNDGRLLQHFIREDLRRLVGQDNSRVILDLHDDLPALPMLLTRTMLYVMREAVINALEHAQATKIRVSIRCNGERLHLMVNDDGRGFIPEAVNNQDHRGLMIMRERVQMIGGELEIISTPGKGTTVWGDLPQKEGVFAVG